ncbi:polysaccharide deacetylase family protein [Marmoricola sp. URHB0036]|uniref:polysaccharide deacetylase family protein n=1 Tax=Marmoricola sp. URHB0036 TaxID=1298863 RepID=UPI000421D193|nr:polysaccharide deacetylase family protein [Marmoricola sp. URHB0036]
MIQQPGEALVAVSPDEGPSVLLTYDDGPDPESTPAVLRELAAAGARATFFVLGTRVRLYPDVFRSVVAEGHEIGLHGADHRRVDQVPEAEFASGLVETKDLLEQVIQRPVVWYRPPYGRFTLSAWAAVHDVGLTTACWTCDIRDWLDVPLEEHLAALDAVTRAGEIVLSHDAYADKRDLVDDGPPPPVDRALLARAVLERISSADCAQPTLSEAMAHGTPVGRPWVEDATT